jgi:hypothetical protein
MQGQDTVEKDTVVIEVGTGTRKFFSWMRVPWMKISYTWLVCEGESRCSNSQQEEAQAQDKPSGEHFAEPDEDAAHRCI